jgi:hypothetical protein
MPKQANPNSKYSQQKARKLEAERIEAEAHAQKQAELEAHYEQIEAENKRLKDAQTAPTDTEESPEDWEENEPLPDLGDLLLREEEAIDAGLDNSASFSDPATDFGGAPTNPEQGQQQSDAPPEPEPKTAEGMGADFSSDLAIFAIDKLNDFVATYLAPHAFMSPKERVWLKAHSAKMAAAAQKGKVTLEITEEEAEIIEAQIQYETFQDNNPLSESEKEMLRKPLSKMIEQSGGGLSPRAALVLALLVIFVGRLAPIAMAQAAKKEREAREPNSKTDKTVDTESGVEDAEIIDETPN